MGRHILRAADGCKHCPQEQAEKHENGTVIAQSEQPPRKAPALYMILMPGNPLTTGYLQNGKQAPAEPLADLVRTVSKHAVIPKPDCRKLRWDRRQTLPWDYFPLARHRSKIGFVVVTKRPFALVISQTVGGHCFGGSERESAGFNIAESSPSAMLSCLSPISCPPSWPILTTTRLSEGTMNTFPPSPDM